MATDTALPQEIIRRKRDGAALSDDEIDLIVGGLAFGSLSEAQIAAPWRCSSRAWNRANASPSPGQ